MNQLAIDFAATHARRSDPRTSKDAAKAAEKFAASHAGRILDCLKAHGPQTVDEIARRLGMQSQQVNKRLPDLEANAKAMPSGLTGLSASGRQERLWVAL